MNEKSESPTAPLATPEPEATRTPRPGFRRPALRKLGALQRVSSAFGGSFTP